MAGRASGSGRNMIQPESPGGIRPGHGGERIFIMSSDNQGEFYPVPIVDKGAGPGPVS